ncbi:MAG: hypothetical protein JO263_08615 [Candidatus Eremiobacteraeota bacterium]|nr:hypothetical protein [Candidatus Eremiobacteraeota bacterium]
MLDLAHVVLHLGFCQAISRAPAGTTVAVRVHLVDRIGRAQVDKVYRIERGDDPGAIVEFDSAFGIYRLDVDAPRYRCSTTDYLFFIAGLNRSITETLHDAPPPAPPKPLLLSGSAPQSFLYVQPTFVLFDKGAVACNKPIPPPLPSNIVIENDQDAYYAWLYPDPASASGLPEQLTLRLRTPTHQYHYVRIPVPYPAPWGGWPDSVQFNITQDMVDDIAGDPVNTLLCPKLWRTSAG